MNSTTSSKSLSRVPLQIILIVPFILLVITAAGLVGYLSLRNGQKAINNVAHELRMEINTRITEHVRFFLGTPHRINQVNATAIGNGTVAADDPNALENRFLEQIRLFDTVTSIYFGNTSGGLADAGREGPAGSMYVIETDGFVKGHFRKYATDSNGKRAGLLATVPDFDSRTRSWYRGAVKKNGAFWSNVYILFTGQDIAISASCPVYDTQQKLIGVVAADIFLSHLSSFLKELDIGRNGQSFIMEHSGMLIASSTDEQPFTVANKASGNRRLEAGQSSVSLIRGSAEALINKFGDYKNISTEQYLEFDFENKRQFLQVSPLHDPYGLNWLIVTVIPESDFMAQIDANKRSTIMLIVIAMMIAVALGIFLSRGITRPVWRLNASTRKMAMGDWDHTVKEDERIQEIAELTLSFNSMARQLKEMFSGLTNEIAEREKAERQLRESEEKYRTLHETMVQGVVYQDEKGRILSANPSAERILGLSVDQMQGITSLDLGWKSIHEDGSPFPGETHPAMVALSSGQPVKNTVMGVFHPEKNDYTWININATPLFRPGAAAPHEVYTTFEDITERKKAEKALLESESLFKNLFEHHAAVQLIIDPSNGSIVDANAAASKFYGWTREQLRQMRIQDINTLSPEEIIKEMEKARVHERIHFEFRHRRSDGSIRDVEVFSSKIEAKGKDILHSIIHDITDRRRLEEELLKIDKLESVGILAGGIAHDFNNLLTSIIGNISIARMRVKSEHKVLELLNAAETASMRARRLTGQLLTFAKGGKPVKETVSIQKLIKESSLFILRNSKSRCEFLVAEDLWPVDADAGQLSQVFSNILINADQSMPEGGIILITAENLMPEKINDIPVDPGRYIRISIKDQGAGIAGKNLSKIFDPYFTTKTEGSGLGLATAYSIIKKHDGHISVDSEPGAGATFHIYLPASGKEIPEKEESADPLKGTGKILVMDDDTLLKEMIGQMLELLGYQAEFAKDGAEAILLFRKARESGKPYDTAILDLTIPGGMGGKEAIKKLLEIDPELKAVVFSGYSDDPVMSNYREYGFRGMMSKPFDMQKLSKVLHDVIKGQ